MTTSITPEIDQIVRSRRRTIALEVHPEKGLIVRAPLRASMRSIFEVVNKHIQWINEKKELISKRFRRQYRPGEEFLFMGQTYSLKYTLSGGLFDLVLDGQHFWLREDLAGQARGVFQKWYDTQARVFLPRRTTELSRQHALCYRKLAIRETSSQWGACSRNGHISLCRRLIMAPERVIDYIILHELAHLRHHNHGKRFHNLLNTLAPEGDESRNWLRQHSHFMVL